MCTAVRAVAIGLGSIVVAVLLGGPAVAQSIPSSSPAIPWLFGDWNGSRTQLQSLGIDFQFNYTGEFAHNATGGVRRTSAYTDQYTAGGTLFLDRLIGIRDAIFQVTIT